MCDNYHLVIIDAQSVVSDSCLGYFLFRTELNTIQEVPELHDFK
jgi:hypothetical protein